MSDVVVVTVKVKTAQGKLVRTRKIVGHVEDTMAGAALLGAVHEAVDEMATEAREKLSL